MKKGAAFRRVSVSKCCSWSQTQLSELARPGPPPLITIGGDMFMSFCNQTSRWRARARLNGANHHQFPLLFKRWNDLRLSHQFWGGGGGKQKKPFLHTCIYDEGDYSPPSPEWRSMRSSLYRRKKKSNECIWQMGVGEGGGQIKALGVQTDFDFGHIVSASTLALTSHARPFIGV